MKKILLSFLLIGFLGFSFISCEKKAPLGPGGEEGDGNETENPDISDDEWLLMDSTYYQTFVVSLWNDYLPEPRHIGGTDFDMRSFTKDYKNAEEVLDALIARTPPDSDGNPIDRFSYIDRANRVGEEIGEGLYRNIGVSLQFMYRPGTNTVGLFIRLVQKNSPSEEAGLIRGMEVLSIDGETLRFSTDDEGYVTGSIAATNKLFTGDVGTLSINDWTTETPETKTINIPSTETWHVDPIAVSNVFELEDSNKKVGYMAYSSFQSVISSGQPNGYHNDLTDLFAEYASAGIDELIVDLRYNGGGATNAAELLTNLIVPAGNTGEIMYKYNVNSILEEWGWTEDNPTNQWFPPVRVKKVGSLNLQRVYFLVTSSSASASEMVINSLKPYMDVQVISTNNRGTYGKPVGSFGIDVEDGKGKRLATLQIISFKMVNANGEGEYFSGIPGDKQNSGDNIFRALGDPQETLLGDALYHIQNGSYRVNTPSSQARIMRGNRSVPVPDAIDVQIDKNVQGLYNLEYKPVLKLDK